MRNGNKIIISTIETKLCALGAVTGNQLQLNLETYYSAQSLMHLDTQPIRKTILFAHDIDNTISPDTHCENVWF